MKFIEVHGNLVNLEHVVLIEAPECENKKGTWDIRIYLSSGLLTYDHCPSYQSMRERYAYIKGYVL